MADESSLGGRALAVRKDVGKTQVEMAQFLGLSTATWQKIERGEGVPSGETLLAFEKLGINPGWVLTGLGPKGLMDFYSADSDAEIFLAVGSFIQEEHTRAEVALPERGLVSTAKRIFKEIMADLNSDSDREERKALLAVHRARYRRMLQSAKDEPGTGKRSA